MPQDPIPLGWCLVGQHDTEDQRGACPVVNGSAGPCSCPCHDGATEPRGFIDAAGG
ncbi:MAG: hypothetical protein ACTHV8_04105 [Nesterenkonia sp.]